MMPCGFRLPDDRSPPVACFRLIAVAAFLISLTSLANGEESIAHPAGLQSGFAETVRPFLTTYCVSCHGDKEPKAKLELGGYKTSADVEQKQAIWLTVVERLEAKEMPPEEAEK